MKVTISFRSTAEAKERVKQYKALPYVTYATDYMKSGERMVMMEIVGELTPEREKELRKLSNKNCKINVFTEGI